MNRIEQLTQAAAWHRQGQLAEAESIYGELLRTNPNDADALQLSGLICYQRGEYQRAIELTEAAVRRGRVRAYVHVNLGAAYRALGRLGDAIKQYQSALKLEPASKEAHNNLANVLQQTGDTEGALRHQKQAIAISPEGDAPSNLLYTLNLLAGFPTSEIARQHRVWGEACRGLVLNSTHNNLKEPTRKLRVGYVSSDFCTHSVAFFLAPLFEAHDRSEVEIIGYSSGFRHDATTARLKALADEWVDISAMSDDDAAQRTREDRVDVLVDLAGHTRGHRLGVFARAPAPVQVTWLGYPNTTGLRTIGYRITDGIVDPEGAVDADHTEQLVRLQNGFLCYEPWDTAPDVAPPPSATTGKITFGSFNNLAKIGPSVIAAWSRILRSVEGSRLILKAMPFADSGVQRLFEARFKAHGVARRQLQFYPEAAGVDEHLARYAEIDIALDPFPYCGTTTTCEALWMGVPVISLVGDRHASRVGLDLLTRVGLPEFAAESLDAYVATAFALAADPARLATLRSGLRGQMRHSPLCDAVRFARELEAAYRMMWKGYCNAERVPGADSLRSPATQR